MSMIYTLLKKIYIRAYILTGRASKMKSKNYRTGRQTKDNLLNEPIRAKKKIQWADRPDIEIQKYQTRSIKYEQI